MIVPETWRGFGHGDLAARARRGHRLRDDRRRPEGEVGEDLRLPAGRPGRRSRRRRPRPTTCAGCTSPRAPPSMPKGVQHSDRTLIGRQPRRHRAHGLRRRRRVPDRLADLPHRRHRHGGRPACGAAATSSCSTCSTRRPSPNGWRRSARRCSAPASPFFRAYLDGQRRHGAEPLFPDLRLFVAGGAPTPAREIIDECVRCSALRRRC